MTQMNLSVKQKHTHRENRLVVADGEGEAEGWSGRWGLADINTQQM